jgi:uncharacterized protein (DUF2235 family)
MAKNVVLCCDGTANEFKANRTNVVRLAYTLRQDPSSQVSFYHPGLGTMEAVGAITSVGRKVTKLLGLAIGYGLEADIRDAYVFLMNHFEPDDRLFMFGFSRGAYTVRCVTSLLHMYGLIRKGNEPLVPYAIRMAMAINKYDRKPNKRAEVEEIFQLAKEFKAHFSDMPCTPYFVGVWDTVSSVGWIENPIHLPYTSNNPDIQIGRHAVAIDERRAFFRTNLWHPTPDGGPKDVKQVWFPGVHCDVGGGYPETEAHLSKFPLAWMLREATAAGLKTDPARVDEVLGRGPPGITNAPADPNAPAPANAAGFVPPDVKGKMHESLKPVWWPVEFVPKRHYDNAKKREARRMNLFRARTIPKGSLIHDSAYLRGADYVRKLPSDAIRVS